MAVEVGRVRGRVGDPRKAQGRGAEIRRDEGREAREEGLKVGERRMGKEKLEGVLRERRDARVQQGRQDEEEVEERLGESRCLLGPSVRLLLPVLRCSKTGGSSCRWRCAWCCC